QLGVANILEGSVQKAGDQVRVNVQLLNAQTDFHLWADTYDRKLVDIFSVESEIARAIAEALQAKLSGGEQRALAVKPTNNPEAYDAYLRGLALEARTTSSLVDQAKVVGFYERAVQLDPAFALAWARLARANPDTVASEARIYQSEGNLEQAKKLLAGVNAQTPSAIAFLTKMNQLFLERHFDEAIRLIHSRLTEYRDLSDIERLFDQYLLVLA